MTEIVNRVKESALIQMDLAKYKPNIQVVNIDIADTLWQRLVLKEKDFRAWIKDHNWEQYQNKAVYVHCSEDAIVPTWAYMIIISKLNDTGCISVVGSQRDIHRKVIQSNISKENWNDFKDKSVIIKGCSDIPEPQFAMSELLTQLHPYVKSVMYGEPCSTVPIYKRKKV